MVDMSWFSSLPLRRWSRQRKKKKKTTNGTTQIVSKVVGRIESFMRATERAPSHHKYEAPASGERQQQQHRPAAEETEEEEEEFTTRGELKPRSDS